MQFPTFALVLAIALATVSAAQQTVYLIRHGEKPSDGSDGLSAQGVERSQCLRTVFGNASNYNIGYIIAEEPESSGSRERPLETVQPLATDLGLTVDISCAKTDSDCVTTLVDSYTGTNNILICWEHGELTDIVTALGDDDAPTYPDDDYNLIWTDPQPYSNITTITSEDCPGLDSD